MPHLAITPVRFSPIIAQVPECTCRACKQQKGCKFKDQLNFALALAPGQRRTEKGNYVLMVWPVVIIAAEGKFATSK